MEYRLRRIAPSSSSSGNRESYRGTRIGMKRPYGALPIVQEPMRLLREPLPLNPLMSSSDPWNPITSPSFTGYGQRGPTSAPQPLFPQRDTALAGPGQMYGFFGQTASSLKAGHPNQASGPKSNADDLAGMNELFAKMVWKKLDTIKSPLRLSRLHTEIMNLIQEAVADEAEK